MSPEQAIQLEQPDVQPRRRVLVVDDDPTFLLLAREALEQSGFAVMVATSAPQAIEAFPEFVPDIVLLDIAVPGGNGFDICRSIRAAPTNNDVPVVLVTGLDDIDSINHAYEVGATDFMHKPILWPTLGNRVQFFLRAHDDRRGLARSERKNRTLLQALPDTCVLVDRRGCITEHLAGSDTPSHRRMVGKPLEQLFPPALAQAARAALLDGGNSTPTTHEFPVGRDERRRWFEARIRPQPDGSLLIVTRDATERRKARARIERLAYYDALTKLPNRTLFVRQVAKAIKEAQATEGLVAIYYLDLDRFKRINDNLGRSTGDALLVQLARRLQKLAGAPGRAAPASSIHAVARLGGDEFAVLATHIADEREVNSIAERIRQALSEPVDLGRHQLVVTPSIGIAAFPRDSGDVDDLMAKADMAMYMAKDRGRNGHASFGQSVAVRSLGRLAIESDMRRAFEAGEFRLHYQPKLDLASGLITGVEALLRWNSPERGPVAPDRFIPIAEEAGLIVPIGAWVLAQACAQVRRWEEQGFDELTVAVNVSVQQFERPDFVDEVLRTLAQTGTPAQRLELEITESLLARNIAQVRTNMERFRAHGVALSIDDFGTGYSSLGYLRQLPVGALKIDRSFVKDLHVNEDAEAICAAIIALARELRLLVIAEGVERQEQLDFLLRHHCGQVQGYLISKPLPAEELTTLLREGIELHGVRVRGASWRETSPRSASTGTPAPGPDPA